MRTRICLILLLLVPLAVYWQTAFHDFAMHSDYVGLREAREEQGQLVRSAAAVGRPLLGAMQETSLAIYGDVENLHWLRLSTVLLLTLLAIVTWKQLCQSDWPEVSAAGISLGLVLLPGAQVLTGWAACWPQALTLLLALAGFSAIETEIERGGMKRVIALLGGCMIYAAASLVYQPNVLFALTILVAVLLERSAREPLGDGWWLGFHLAAIVSGLLIGRLVMRMLYSIGVFHAATDGAGNHFLDYFRYPLPNALALFALNDDHQQGALFYWGTALGVAVLCVLGYRKLGATDQPLRQRRALYAACILGVATLAVCATAHEPVRAYRTSLALAGIVLILATEAVRVLLPVKKLGPWLYSLPAVALLAFVWSAQRNAVDLIAEPQGREWEAVHGEVVRANFKQNTRVHLLLPPPAAHAADRAYGDEFGSVSSASEDVARAMFRAAMRERFGDKMPKGMNYVLTTSVEAPPAGSYDLLVNFQSALR